jgi:hypothetical protein
MGQQRRNLSSLGQGTKVLHPWKDGNRKNEIRISETILKQVYLIHFKITSP